MTIDKNEANETITETSEANFEATMQREHFIGNLTGWRKLKNPQRKKEKILKGHNKILGLMARLYQEKL